MLQLFPFQIEMLHLSTKTISEEKTNLEKKKTYENESVPRKTKEFQISGAIVYHIKK